MDLVLDRIRKLADNCNLLARSASFVRLFVPSSESFWTISPSEAQDSKASASTTHAAAEQDPALAASCWRGRRGLCRKGVDSIFTVLKFRAQARGYAEDLVSSQGCPWIMARRARSPSPCGAALRWLLPSSSRTTQSCACILSWSTPM